MEKTGYFVLALVGMSVVIASEPRLAQALTAEECQQAALTLVGESHEGALLQKTISHLWVSFLKDGGKDDLPTYIARGWRTSDGQKKEKLEKIMPTRLRAGACLILPLPSRQVQAEIGVGTVSLTPEDSPVKTPDPPSAIVEVAEQSTSTAATVQSSSSDDLHEGIPSDSALAPNDQLPTSSVADMVTVPRLAQKVSATAILLYLLGLMYVWSRMRKRRVRSQEMLLAVTGVAPEILDETVTAFMEREKISTT